MHACFGCLSKKAPEVFLEAVREGNHGIAQTTLLDNPSLAKSVTLLGHKNALHLAAEEGHLVVLVAVLEILACQESVRSAENGDVEDDPGSIRNILNAQDVRGQTPLFMAAALGHTDCARLLITNGADRTIPDLRGNLPLHIAAWWGHLSIAFMLLDFALPEGVDAGVAARAAVNQGNVAGLTPLHMAVWGKRFGIMQILLQHDADITVQSGTQPQPDILLPCRPGSTPLHLAATRGSVEICNLLLKTHYERVVEPLLLEYGEDVALIVASADDPRMRTNDMMQMPYQIAQRMGFAPLAMLLRPSISLERLFGNVDHHTPRIYGTPALKTIATEAVNRLLASTIHNLIREAAEVSAAGQPHPSRATSAAGSPASRKQSRRQLAVSQLIISAEEDLAGPQEGSAVSARSPLHATSPLAPATPGQVAASRSVSRPLSRASSLGGVPRSPSRLLEPPVRQAALPGMMVDEALRDADQDEQLLREQLSQLLVDAAAGAGWAAASSSRSPLKLGGPVRQSDGVASEGSSSRVGIPTPTECRAYAATDSRGREARGSITLAATSEIYSELVIVGGLQQRAVRGGSPPSGSPPACHAAMGGPFQRTSLGATSPDGRVDVMLDDLDQIERGLGLERCCSDSGAHSEREQARRDAGNVALEDEVVMLRGASGGGGGGGPLEYYDEECGVCLEALPDLTVGPCKHRLCGACALKICTSDIKKPSLCPFCRSLIHNFTAAPSSQQ